MSKIYRTDFFPKYMWDIHHNREYLWVQIKSKLQEGEWYQQDCRRANSRLTFPHGNIFKNYNDFIGALENSQRSMVTKRMPKQEKATLKMVDNFMAFLFILAPPSYCYSTLQSEESSRPVPSSFSQTRGKRVYLFVTFKPV